jgi:hypothetical protein
MCRVYEAVMSIVDETCYAQEVRSLNCAAVAVQSVYVGNLPVTATEEKLKEMFSKFGEVRRQRLIDHLASMPRSCDADVAPLAATWSCCPEGLGGCSLHRTRLAHLAVVTVM